MKIGLHIADFTFPAGAAGLADDLTRIAAEAEEQGFARVSVMDHVWQIQVVGPPENDMLEAYTTLGYLAARTSTVELLAWVTAVTYREPGHAGQAGHHARRAVEGPGLAGHRGGLERGGGHRAGAAVPAHRGALRAAGGDAADLPADVERLRRTLRRHPLQAGAHAQRAAGADPAAPADPDRRWRGEEDAAHGRPVRAGLQPVPRARTWSASWTCCAGTARTSGGTTTRSRRR